MSEIDLSGPAAAAAIQVAYSVVTVTLQGNQMGMKPHQVAVDVGALARTVLDSMKNPPPRPSEKT